MAENFFGFNNWRKVFCILVIFIGIHQKMIVYRILRILSGVQNY